MTSPSRPGAPGPESQPRGSQAGGASWPGEQPPAQSFRRGGEQGQGTDPRLQPPDRPGQGTDPRLQSPGPATSGRPGRGTDPRLQPPGPTGASGGPGPGSPAEGPRPRQAQGPSFDQPQGPPGRQGAGPGQSHPAAHGSGPRGETPGAALGRDPADPYKPFVTAGQISGPKTPPPARQQEIWDTVFSDDDEPEERRPFWIFALIGSVVVALLAVLLWAFLAGPLAGSDEEPSDGVSGKAAPTTSPQGTTRSQSITKLPRFPGRASAVSGTLTDSRVAITVPRLGGVWRLDTRPSVMKTYGYATRQYVAAGQDTVGKPQFAQVMTGPLQARLKSKYSSPENLLPVVNAVAVQARQKLFPSGNAVRKTSQQSLSIQGMPGQLAAWQVTTGQSTTTMVVAAISTGDDLPAIVYMSVPDNKKQLLPDINTVFQRIRLTGS
ncbi:hypothetical protein [Sinosporangium siamense]|nr:hypothetical protein [Sinosporangium siamense]